MKKTFYSHTLKTTSSLLFLVMVLSQVFFAFPLQTFAAIILDTSGDEAQQQQAGADAGSAQDPNNEGGYTFGNTNQQEQVNSQQNPDYTYDANGNLIKTSSKQTLNPDDYNINKNSSNQTKTAQQKAADAKNTQAQAAAQKANAAQVNQRANSLAQTGNGSTTQQRSAKTAGVGAAGACIGGILGQAVARAALTIAGNLIGSLFSSETDPQVPVAPKSLNAKETGLVVFGIPTGISWDSVGYCIVNALITYIAQSTIEWVKSGFNGNPAFLENPDKYFQNLADRNAGAFIQEIGQGNTVCQPFRTDVQLGLLNSYSNNMTGSSMTGGGGNVHTGTSTNNQNNLGQQYQQNKVNYNSGYSQRSGCTLSPYMQNTQNYQQFTNGDFSKGGMDGFFQTIQPNNNYYGAKYQAQEEMQARIAKQNNSAQTERQIGNGFMDFKECEGPIVNGKATEPCKVTTPGKLIQGKVENRLNLGENRLVLANQFDQVVSALVNELVKLALNKVLNNDSSGSTQNYANSNDGTSGNTNSTTTRNRGATTTRQRGTR